MIQLPYRIPYRTNPVLLIGGTILCGFGIWFFAHDALTNKSILLVYGTPLAPEQTVVIFWAKTALMVLLTIVCVVAFLRQLLAPLYLELTESTIALTRGSVRNEISYRMITSLTEYRRSRSKIVVSFGVQAFGRKYIFSAYKFPNQAEFEKIRRHLIAIMASRQPSAPPSKS